MEQSSQFSSNEHLITHKEAIIRHFSKRARQRFRMRIDGGDYKTINEKIRNGDYVLEKQRGKTKIVRLPYRNKDIRCYFNTELNCLMTAIPVGGITLERSIRYMFDWKEMNEKEDVFAHGDYEVRTSRKFNYVKLLKKNVKENSKGMIAILYDTIFQCGYPAKLKQIDEIVLCLKRKAIDIE